MKIPTVPWCHLLVGFFLVRAASASVSSGALQAHPPAIKLHGLGDRFQVLIRGPEDADLTREVRYQMAPADLATVSVAGVLIAKRDGIGSLEARTASGQVVTMQVEVTGCAQPKSFGFENDITPILSRFGCNTSGCHGKAEGQNGFKLSVFGYDAQADYRALVMEGRGRRIFPVAPENSLFMQKMSGGLPHGGGVRIAPGSAEYGIVRDWIAAGAPFGQGTAITRLEISPSERVMAMNTRQVSRVIAVFADGRRGDVTHLAQFQSNNEAIARVAEDGLITAGSLPGAAAIMARFRDATTMSQILVPQPGALPPSEPAPRFNFIDGLVDQRLEKLRIRPSAVATDAEFIRRVFLDVIGTLPTPDEARAFLTDADPAKRPKLVNALLERPEYADFWALRWADLLRVDRQVLGHRDAYAYYQWIRESLRANKPMDRVVTELLTASGPTDDAPQGNFYKLFAKPGEMASSFSQTFLGVRIACAECHHHPFDRWSQDDFYSMQAFFQPVQRTKGVMGDELRLTGVAEATNPRTKKNLSPRPLAVETARKPEGDPRSLLAAWCVSGDNAWFARNLANRYVAHFLGRGLVEPVDDVRATNPPSNPELLDALSKHVVESKFDLKALIRAVTASRTYQLSSQPNESNERDEQNYSRALFKRMPAEVLLDAVCQATGVPEKFSGVPLGSRAIQVWDNDVSHYFLKLFGRPVRKTTCECERNTEASVAQVLHLLNSPRIEAKLSHDAGAIARLAREIGDPGQLIETLYLTFYSRFPTEEERQRVLEHFRKSRAPRAAAEDLAWSMLNSIEFVFNH